MYYENDTKFKICNDTKQEDSTCSRSTWGISISDHLRYLGMSTGCADPNTAAMETVRSKMSNNNHSSSSFYDDFDHHLLSCGDKGFIKGVAKELHNHMKKS